MSIEKRILKYQADRISLSSDKEKVELGMHDDMLKWEKRAKTGFSDVKQRLDVVLTSLRNVKHNYEVAEGILEDAMKMAKELGAKNLITLYSKRDSSIKSGIKEVSRYITKIKGI